MQVKPALDDPATVYVRIPNSQLAIRIWPGGMAHLGQFCFDFFDVARRVPVDPPAGYTIEDSTGGTQMTWEAAFEWTASAPSGSQKYSAPEGTHLVLRRPGEAPLHFRIPVRPRAPVQYVAFAPLESTLPTL